MRYLLLFVSFLLSLESVLGQNSQYHYLDYKWQNESLIVNDSKSHFLNFQFEHSYGNSNYELQLLNPVYTNCDEVEKKYLKNFYLDSVPQINSKSGISQKKLVVRGEVFPFIKIDDTYKKLVFCEIEVRFSAQASSRQSNATVDHSVLSSGKWYKISLARDGIYRISSQNLQDLGMNISALNPKNLRIYGHPGGLLPTANVSERPVDLVELAIQVVGESDGSFDQNDYILFYGQSPNQWALNNDGLFSRQQHYYDNFSHYFITSDLGEGKRVSSAPSLSSSDTIITTFDDYQIHEKEEVNFIKSGSKWYGDVFDLVNTRTFNFNFPNRVNTANLKIVLAANSESPYNSIFSINATGLSSQNVTISGISGSYNKANVKTFEESLNAGSDNIQLTLNFSSSSSYAKGWIDYIELNAQRELKMSGNQMHFRSLASVKTNSVSQFMLSNANSNTSVWEITDPLSPQLIQGQSSASDFSFNLSTESLRQFVAFDGGYLSANLLGAVSNQDLHALKDVDYLIISHPTFLVQANRLANFHESNGLNVEVVIPQQIYNEFSSGSQDVSAIRDFAKMLYEQENPLRYLLLFGDASYDPKNRLTDNTNFIVSYQSANSSNELYSYVTDDYFALLDEEESLFSDATNIPFLDIGVGRFPVQTIEEAENAVDKVIAYSSLESFGDWRLNMCFVGDDNDEAETVHSLQAEQLADYIASSHPNMNVDKIYLDAYEQESSTGGQRCASANNAISEAINKGMFVVNYTGHGGELGWAHERILEIDDINSWNNPNTLPLFMTATCEFSRYDDPARVSAGEEVFLKKDGGAIALLTTSRVVFTGSNLDLNTSFLENLFPKDSDESVSRLGDVLMRTKNNTSDPSNTNHRNFTLLGDPALQLAYPQYDIVLTEVQDSAKALGLVTISGEVRHEGVKLTAFNGLVFPKVYDKRRDFQTLGQDESPVFVFDLQKNVLFKGKSSVENGEFSFSFIVPKDINYDFGKGKISLYAKGNIQEEWCDAFGHNLDMVVGGTSSEYQEDNTGPQISLFMNDTNFIMGGVTNANPSIHALLFDENGINTVSNGIGHEMLAILDGETSSPIILNDFYESNTDSYKSGVINYPFNTLPEGKHSLRVKIWDVHNNSAESTTEFVVMPSNNLTIQNLLNYPNPVADFTSFYFEHNQNNEPMQITLCIMDLQGRRVNEIKQNIVPNGYRYGPITWNGTSQNGSKLKAGIYVYSMIASLSNGKTASNSGRLILIE
ncbi:type IX secretion system sortase PorU [Flavobacteriales bacterium]|nr:type IX secretion system sortase PorU [Flavobacteriales bacterium]